MTAAAEDDYTFAPIGAPPKQRRRQEISSIQEEKCASLASSTSDVRHDHSRSKLIRNLRVCFIDTLLFPTEGCWGRRPHSQLSRMIHPYVEYNIGADDEVRRWFLSTTKCRMTRILVLVPPPKFDISRRDDEDKRTNDQKNFPHQYNRWWWWWIARY